MKASVITLLLLLTFLTPSDVMAQRRSRPGSMKHTQTEIDNHRKETPATATYIRNNAYFEGPISYMGTKTGTGGLMFINGRYIFSFDAAKFKTRTANSDDWRKRLWGYEKISEDFEHSGKYKVIKQYGEIALILYDKDSDNIFAKIPLSSADTKTLEIDQDGFLIKLTFVR